MLRERHGCMGCHPWRLTLAIEYAPQLAPTHQSAPSETLVDSADSRGAPRTLDHQYRDARAWSLTGRISIKFGAVERWMRQLHRRGVRDALCRRALELKHGTRDV